MSNTLFSQYFTQSLSSLKTSLPSIQLINYDITSDNYYDSLSYLAALFQSSSLHSHLTYIKTLLGIMPPSYFKFSYHLLSLYLLIHNELTSFSSSEYLKSILNVKLYEITSLIQNIPLNGNNTRGGDIAFAIVIVIELLFELILSVYEKMIKFKIDINDCSASQIENDMKNIYIISNSFEWLKPVLIAIDFIYTVKRGKPFVSLYQHNDNALYNVIHKKNLVNYLSTFVNIIALVKRYYIIYKDISYDTPRLFDSKRKEAFCDIEELNSIISKMVELIMENLLINYKLYEKEFQRKISFILVKQQINSMLLFLSSLYDNVSYIKFNHTQYKVDYHSYFIFYYDFNVFLCDKVNEYLSMMIESILCAIKNRNLNDIENSINLQIVDEYIRALKDFIVYHMIASFNNDSLCDCFVKNEWLRSTIFSYSIIHSVRCMIISIKEYEMKKKEMLNINKDFIIKRMFELLSERIIKNNVIFPVKLFIYKEMLIHNALIIFEHFAEIFNEDLREMIHNRTINADILIKSLNEISESQNIFSFFISQKILRYLNFNGDISSSYHGKMRIYTTPAFPLDYYDISNSDRSKLSSQQRYSSMTIDTDDKENSSCYSNMNNEVTNGNSNSNYRTNHKKAKKKDSITSLMLIEEFDISSIICNLNFASFDDISDPSISYSLKNKRYVLSYSMKNSFSSPVILIQGMYNMDRISYDTPNNSLMISSRKKISSKMAIENILQCLLYGEVTGNMKKNLEATMKYYDTKFKMNYFEFIDSIKKIII